MQQRPRSSYKSGKAALDTGINYTTNFSYKQTYIAGAESDYSFRGDKRVDNGQGDDGDEWSEYASHLDQLEQEYTSLKETEQKKRLMMAARETTNSYAWVNRDHNNGSSRPSSRASSRSSSSRPQSSHRRERNRTGNNKNDNHINNHNNDTIVDGKGTSGTLPRNKNQLQNLASTTPVTRGDDTLYDLDYSNSDISTAENNPRYQALSLSPHSQSHAHLSSRPQSSYSPRSHPHTHARTRPSPEHHNYLSHATKLSASPLSSHTPSPLRTETGHRTRLSPRSWINSAGGTCVI